MLRSDFASVVGGIDVTDTNSLLQPVAGLSILNATSDSHPKLASPERTRTLSGSCVTIRRKSECNGRTIFRFSVPVCVDFKKLTVLLLLDRIG